MSEYKLVPVEPTPEMERAAEKYWNDRKLKALSDDPRTWKGLYAAMLAAAPAVQGEPVGEVRFELGAPSSIFAELYSKSLPALAPGTKLYAAPQPAPDVAGLVEALELARRTLAMAALEGEVTRRIDIALSPYRKGGEA